MIFSNYKFLVEVAVYIAAFGITDFLIDHFNIQPLQFYLPLFLVSLFLLNRVKK